MQEDGHESAEQESPTEVAFAQEIVHHKEWADESLMRDGVLMKNSVCLPRTPAFIPAPGAQIRAAEIFTPAVPVFRDANAP